MCGNVQFFRTDPSPATLTAHCTLRELSAALFALCSHSLHRPAEVVVPDGALPARGGVQSAPGPVGVELQQWTQSQNHQGTQGWPLHPPPAPLHLGWKRACRSPGQCRCPKVRPGTAWVHLWTGPPGLSRLWGLGSGPLGLKCMCPSGQISWCFTCLSFLPCLE